MFSQKCYVSKLIQWFFKSFIMISLCIPPWNRVWFSTFNKKLIPFTQWCFVSSLVEIGKDETGKNNAVVTKIAKTNNSQAHFVLWWRSSLSATYIWAFIVTPVFFNFFRRNAGQSNLKHIGHPDPHARKSALSDTVYSTENEFTGQLKFLASWAVLSSSTSPHRFNCCYLILPLTPIWVRGRGI